jgi:hypothetical protein
MTGEWINSRIDCINDALVEFDGLAGRVNDVSERSSNLYISARILREPRRGVVRDQS